MTDTPEFKELRAELRDRIASEYEALVGMSIGSDYMLDDAMIAASSEGHVVDVRYQPDAKEWTVKFHATMWVPMTVSHHADSWTAAFVQCFRQADDLRAQHLVAIKEGRA